MQWSAIRGQLIPLASCACLAVWPWSSWETREAILVHPFMREPGRHSNDWDKKKKRVYGNTKPCVSVRTGFYYLHCVL